MIKTRYEIPEHRVSILTGELERLAKRARRLGLPETIRWELGESLVKNVPIRDGRKADMMFREVWVEGEAPKYNGWRLVAVLEPLEGEGNMVRTVPGINPVDFKPFRTAKIACDHCKTSRRRAETFLVEHDGDHVVRQIGRNCLVDFLGGDSPESLAAEAELLIALAAVCGGAEDEGEGGGFGGGRWAWSLEEFLGATMAMIRGWGWVSRTKSRESFKPILATADQVIDWLNPLSDRKREAEDRDGNKLEVTDRDRELAARATEWAANLPEDTDSDYLWNVRIVGRFGYVDGSSAGVAASIATAYARQIGLDLDTGRPHAVSKHLGEVGKVLEVPNAVLVRTRDIDGDFGTKRMHEMKDAEGNVIVWWASGTWPQVEIGDTVYVVGKVKKHDNYRGVAQTVITRAEVCTPEERARRLVAADAAKAAAKALSKAKAKARREAAKVAKAAGAVEGLLTELRLWPEEDRVRRVSELQRTAYGTGSAEDAVEAAQATRALVAYAAEVPGVIDESWVAWGRRQLATPVAPGVDMRGNADRGPCAHAFVDGGCRLCGDRQLEAPPLVITSADIPAGPVEPVVRVNGDKVTVVVPEPVGVDGDVIVTYAPTPAKAAPAKLTDVELRNHDCRAAGEFSWWEHDVQGIPLRRVCKVCKAAKLAGYRPEILRGYSQADVDEPIEPDHPFDLG